MDVDVVKKIPVEYSKSDKLIVALDQHDNLHIAMYIGQGAYDSRPVERFVDEIKETVIEPYQSEQFILDGTIISYPGCPVLRRLKVKDTMQQEFILNRVKMWTGSDEAALNWYETETIAAFGMTAKSAVGSGFFNELIDYIESISQGGYA
ncbi:hypothetical protein GCHA_4721 [Paraglaciecola chathamensis S18K6]|uniref:Transposase n=2 Tax=Paraglaciecola chathamensis TaxID=368405 RepID=A0AAV3V6Y1_9ALTE|nr:hypothetical protein GCHA_4721 [Paraglaciecola chathamensis S18K6]